MGCCLPEDIASFTMHGCGSSGAERRPATVHANGHSCVMGSTAVDGLTASSDGDGEGAGWEDGRDGDVSAANSGEWSVPAMLIMLLGPATDGSGLTNHVVIQLLHVHWV